MNYSPFGSVPVPKKKRTNFPMGHSVSGTFPLSKLCPVCFIDSIPGSSWNINVHNLTKLETLIAPAMQRVDASILWFKMPKRLVFKHFKKWYSGGEKGDDNHQKPHFYIAKFIGFLQSLAISGDEQAILNMVFGPGSLWQYLGLPCPLSYNSVTGVWSMLDLEDLDHNSDGTDFIDLMPIMAYQYLYDTMFRDQTLCEAVFTDSEEGIFIVDKGIRFTINGHKYYVGPQAKKKPTDIFTAYTSGNDLAEGGEISSADVFCLLHLFSRAWRKDYYTSALPTPQRGPEVTLNLLGDEASAPVTGEDVDWSLHARNMSDQDVIHAGSLLKTEGEVDPSFGYTDTPLQLEGESQGSNYYFDTGLNVEGLAADLSGLSPITIVALRNLFKLQSFMEKNNVAGGRYIESILAHWGERVPDFTVQRPQFVRATSLPVQIMEVTATANSSGVNSQVGDQAGRARTQGNLGFVHIYTQEPSFIFGLYCVTAPGSYASQGIPRIWQHRTRYDEPWTEFQHIGEQAIKARELYYDFVGLDSNDLDFGYQQRYSEYKYMPDRVVGYFQTSLAYWHMARMFTKVPSLNEDFVTQHLDPRIFAVHTSHPVTADFYFDIKAKLKLSKYSTPKLT